jgi:ABC-type sugar transport system substrate-binding protein
MYMKTNRKNSTRASQSIARFSLTCLLAYALTSVLLPGCKEEDQTPAPANLIGLSLPDNPGAYVKTLVSGLESSLKNEGYTLVVTNAEGKTENRRTQLNAMLNIGVKAIALVSPGDDLSESIAAIRARSIPVVSLLESLAGANAAILNDSRGEGIAAATAANRLLPSGGVYQVLYMMGATTEADRTALIEGLTDSLTASITKYSNPLSCVDTLSALSRAKSILSRNIQLCIAMDDESLQGFVRALDESDKTPADVKIIAFSGSPVSKRLLRDGKIAAVIARAPLSAAASIGPICAALVNGQPVEPTLLIPSILITSENIGQHDAETWE